MKKLLGIAVAMLVLGACVPAKAEPIYGLFYKNTWEAGGGSSEVKPSKEGCAVCRSYFGLVGLGDCSIKSAMDNGCINNLAFYDTRITNVIGFKKVIVRAYGE